jgi:four helix bundle protein
MTVNAILEKSKTFALRIIKLYKYLREDRQEYVLSKQILRSGTSIGANSREGKIGQTKPDFYTKFNIALKEAEETAYWLELLYESEYIDKKQFDSIYNDCDEIISILVSITKSHKTGVKKNEF